MGAMEMVRQWRASVKDFFSPLLHGHQIKALADVSWAMAQTGHCHSGKVATAMVACSAARVDSCRRRIERLLSNPRLDGQAAMDGLGESVLSCWGSSGRNLILILDETTKALPPPPGAAAAATPQGHALCWMQLSVGYRKRAIPIACVCYRSGELAADQSQPQMVLELLEQVARRLLQASDGGVGGSVTLLADRGLCWVSLIDFCQEHHWHYVLRLQRQTKVKIDGIEREVRQLVRRPGNRFAAEGVEIFKTAGWRKANIMATWEQRCREPWLLVSDLPSSYARCRGYAKRSWCEQMHRDEKSSGLCFHQSHITDADHALKLWLLIALALLLAASIGSYVLKKGLRYQLECHRRRRQLSIVQLGLRWMRQCVIRAGALPIALHLYPP